MIPTLPSRLRPLAEVDPEIASTVASEVDRQARTIELIASENFVSEAVLEALGSVLTTSTRKACPASAITAAASTWTWPRRSPSSAPRSFSAPTT